MEGKVLLYDSNDIKIGDTYVRRARQLVKQQRAYWIDDSQSAIRFLPGAEKLDAVEEMAEDRHDSFAVGMPGISDVKLRKLARRNVIIWIVYKSICLGYAAVIGFLTFMWFFVAGRGFFWPGVVMLGWGFGIIILGIIFKAVTTPAAVFRGKVEDEYNRLKHY